jgi:hypothetical protein
MNVADRAGLGPKRELSKNEDETWTLKVSPPAWAGFDPDYSSSIVLTEDQVKRFCEWQDTGILIQNAFPDLNASQREIILSGIGNNEFQNLADDEDEASF